jgi:MYXO-CTERM domain-containing protein
VSKDDDGGCSVRAPGDRSGSRSTLAIALSLLGVFLLRRRPE